MDPLTAIVLCGGRSTRMGRDKAALPFGGETLLDRAVKIAGAVASEVIVVSRPDGPAAVAPTSDVTVRTVHDPVAHLGPLAGLAAGLAASATEVNVVLACDMPLIKPEVLRRLIAWRGDADICVAIVDGHASPLCAVYRKPVGDVAAALVAAGERRVMALLDRVQTKRVEAAAFRDLDPNLESFLSCNTPEAYRQARLKADATSR